MQDAVDNLSVLKQDDDAGRETHHEGGGKDVLGARKQFFGNPIGAEPGNDAADDAHSEEQAGNLRQIPVPAGHTHDQQDDGEQQHAQDPSLPMRERRVFHRDGLRRRFAGLMGINHHENGQ